MRHSFPLFCVGGLLAAIGWTAIRLAPAAAPAEPASPSVDFVRDIRPIFSAHCYQCHDAAKHKGGLRLDNRNEAMLGGDNGADILAHDADHSRLLHLVRGDDPDAVMPAKGPRLSPAEIETLTTWIRQGASWPDNAATSGEVAPTHWSFIKPRLPEIPPGLKHHQWIRNPIDAFVLAKLEENAIEPSPEADRYTLIRRASLDLIGLPPTPQEVDAFVNDSRPDAYEQLIDRLLANPHFGERWARMWLDVARYADSAGYGSDPLRKTIYRYRDWVIDAFNRNLPYDQFTIDQIAGDLLPHPTMDDLIATAFNRNTMTNTEGGTDAEEFRVAAVKDRVDTTVQAWMGLTVGCATCHSHKYDPITNREYYQLFAIFNQTEDNNSGDESPTIPTPSVEQQQKYSEMNARIAQAEREMADPARIAVGEAAWEKSLAATPPTNWAELHPSKLASSSGATLTALPDGSILASGARGDKDTYAVEALTDLRGITAFRVEALPDASLPAGGPGRGGDGNFVLSDFRVTAAAPANANIRGRFVRVENAGPQRYLHLAEVQVFSGTQNLALKGTASESSIDYGGEAKRAIDGNTDGEFFRSNSVTHTKLENDPWWEVDLGAANGIDRIVIWNRTDGGAGSRLTDGRVTVFDESHKPVWQIRLASPPNPSVELGPSAGQSITLMNSTDDFHQIDPGATPTEWSAAKAIDADPNLSGWAIKPQVGRAHAAVFETSANAGIQGTQLTFTLAQNFPSASLGKFRISATTDRRPIRLLPAAVTDALATVPANRTEAQKQALSSYYATFAPELAASRKQIAAMRKELDSLKPPMTAIMRELPPNRARESHVLIKGNFLSKGPAVQPAVLSAFNPMPSGAPANRLGLAMWIVDKENPLTARVAVNRFWGQIFGAGIVETQEDFGTQGTAPVDQPLLDWMAIDFMSHGWDIKGLLRTILTSAAYRQSSRVSPELLQKDPHDRLLSRGPRLRLEAELVRDQALALSGLLSSKMFGPSVYPPQPDGLWQAAFNGERNYPTSTGEDSHRRGVYTFWRRTTPYPSMAAFDAPSREVCTLRRIQTSTPLQAFVMLNDPVYVECAQALARRMMKEGGDTPESRAAYGVKVCLCRMPTESQTEDLVDLYRGELSRYQADKSSAMKSATEPVGPLPAGMDAADAAAWTVVANVLLNLDGVLSKN